MKKQTLDYLSVLIAGIFGIVLFLLSSNSFQYINKKCTNALVNNGILIICTIGAVLTTMAISFGLCNRNMDCYTQIQSAEHITGNIETYINITVVLNVVVLILGGAIFAAIGQNKDCSASGNDATASDKSNVRTLKVNITLLLVISFLSLIVSGFSLYKYHYGVFEN